jgi:hypothetical protein
MERKLRVEHGKSAGLLVRPSDSLALANGQKVIEEFDVNKETAKLREYLLRSC